MVFDRRALRFLIDYIGADRLLVGSDFPAMLREEPAARTLRSMDLPPEQWADISGRNAFRWLGIDPPD
jgi:aminocarboxymuconate-semialdehyde decarboxylase